MRSFLTFILAFAAYLALGAFIFDVNIIPPTIAESGRSMIINIGFSWLLLVSISVLTMCVLILILGTSSFLLAEFNNIPESAWGSVQSYTAITIGILYPIVMTDILPRFMYFPDFSIVEFIVIYVLAMITAGVFSSGYVD